MKYTSESRALKNEEATNMLCWILEAVFIHGLKNTFIRSLFTSRRDNSIPNPSFWDFLVIFSHRDVIEQIRRLNYVNSDVGRARAWIRITLNEMSLVSYLENMFRNPSYVRNFYKPSAFLRDVEKCEILKNFLVGIESCKFDLVVDNSLLNQWTSGPLSLVGLWTDDNISQGIDVAQNMDSKDLQAIPQLGKSKTPEPEFMAALRRQPLLAEEDALRIIMASKPSPSSNASSRRNSDSSQPGGIKDQTSSGGHLSRVGCLSSRKSTREPVLHQTSKTVSSEGRKNMIKPSIEPRIVHEPLENNILKVSAAEEVDSQPQKNLDKKIVLEERVTSNEDKLLSLETQHNENEELSYVEILTAYTREKKVGAEIYSGSPMDSHLLEGFKTTTDSDTGLEETTSSLELNFGTSVDDGFEIISAFSSNHQLEEMYPRLKKFAGKIANEVGMDVQQYQCKFCHAPIGMSFAASRVCHFTGNYFCASCHQLDTSVIPARLLLNWDFSSYNVCKLSHAFLEEVKNEAIFDLEQINPQLYSYIDELAEIRDLRIKLNYVSIYLKTCKDETVLQEFKKEIWPRDYLFEKIHLYSLVDLLNVSNRTLTVPLTKLLKFGKSHIIVCKICKSKGFVCEQCRNPEVIFPFNLESTFKCRFCGAVYHGKCMNYAKPCPRCQRWKRTFSDEDICDYINN